MPFFVSDEATYSGPTRELGGLAKVQEVSLGGVRFWEHQGIGPALWGFFWESSRATV